MTPLDFDSEITPADIEIKSARLAAGESMTFDTRHRRKDGTEYPVEIRIRPLWIDGKLHTLALVCDITERKQAEQKLQESQERLQLALAASRMGVWEWDISSDDVFWSPECFDIFQVSSFDGRAETFRQYVHPDDLVALGKDVERAIREATYTTWEFRIRTRDGQERWIANCATVRRDESGRALKMIGTARRRHRRKARCRGNSRAECHPAHHPGEHDRFYLHEGLPKPLRYDQRFGGRLYRQARTRNHRPHGFGAVPAGRGVGNTGPRTKTLRRRDGVAV